MMDAEHICADRRTGNVIEFVQKLPIRIFLMDFHSAFFVCISIMSCNSSMLLPSHFHSTFLTQINR